MPSRAVDAGIPVVSQTVLLRGINDDADTLEALMRASEARVKPYYLITEISPPVRLISARRWPRGRR